jgi:hypothetical protein
MGQKRQVSPAKEIPAQAFQLKETVRILSGLVQTSDNIVEESFAKIEEAQANVDACVRLIDARR